MVWVGVTRRPARAVAVAVVLAAALAVPAAAPASSLDAHRAPAWWLGAKFGIFIHWGPYSVPAWGPVTPLDLATNLTPYAEWYAETMTIPGTATWQHHLATYGPAFGYDDFIGQWKAERWDPDAWIRLFRRANAKYFVLTSKHSDGFALWCSKTSMRDSCDMGPHRDLVGDLMAAAHRAHDVVRPGLYYSVPEWQSPAPKEPALYSANNRWDSTDRLTFEVAYESALPRRNPYTQLPIGYDGYVPIADYAKGQVTPQVQELIRQFKPAVLWCDIGGRETYYHANEWVADYYKAVPDGVVDDRCGDLSTHADYTTVERAKDTVNPPFEVVQGMAGLGSSFGLNAALPDSSYQSADQLIDTLVDTVATGGNLLLDIGPRADGTIPQVMADRLESIGAWLDVNGEAIFDTHAWTQARAGAVRFTAGPAGFLYATSLGWPRETLTIDAPVPLAKGTRVALLGTDERPLAFRREGSRLVVALPAQASSKSRHAYALRIGPRLAARVTARRTTTRITGRVVTPKGVTRAMGCRGRVQAAGRGATVDKACRFSIRVPRRSRARRVTFAGNPVLRPAVTRASTDPR